ncbi:retrovirus-related pol polyprotein from transposon TNT 1-94 [Tanacetum coccineum]|uniref:Retrovirus-related pol polyprotein from transposon TNT 1-94 n=1 Tax=Tanacetum coccineum TaxID=301880 RepID=A0ABQ5D7U1_9ASTR
MNDPFIIQAKVEKYNIWIVLRKSSFSHWNKIALIYVKLAGIDEIDIDDLYNNLRVYEDELKRSSGSNSASQNLAFLSSENTSSTNEVSTASGDFGVSTGGGINKVPSTLYGWRLSWRNWDLRWQGGYVDCQSKEVHSKDRKEFGLQRKMTCLDEYVIRNKIIDSQTTKLNTKTNETAVIIEDWNLDDEEEEYEVQTVRPETQTVKTKDDKSGQNSKKQGISFRKVKACFVCKSTNHLIKDCNIHDKKSQEPKLKNVVNTGQRESKPVWDNTKRINHQNFSKYPHLSKTFVPLRVLTRTGLHRPSVSTGRPVCTVRPSVSTARPVCTARPSVSTARPVCTARPSVSTARHVCTARPVYATRPIYPRMDNTESKGSFSCKPRTPQQNGVAERKNRTLIEAARTMLADSLLPIPFWAEAVNTACYVLNRVLVTKPQNKTPYELLIDSFDKFDGKSDEGYLLG